MYEVLNDFASYLNTILEPLDKIVGGSINYSFVTISLLCVAFVAFYRSITDRHSLHFHLEEIIRNFFNLIIVILLAGGNMNMLVLVFTIYIFLNIFMDIKETAHRRFTRIIE